MGGAGRAGPSSAPPGGPAAPGVRSADLMARDRRVPPRGETAPALRRRRDPGRRAKDAVEEAFAPWRERFPKARWAPRENWHVTLKFLGRTWPRLTDWVPKQVEEAAKLVEPFRSRVTGVGGFPSAGEGARAVGGPRRRGRSDGGTRRTHRGRVARGVPGGNARVPSSSHRGAERSAAEAPTRVRRDAASDG